MYRFVLTLSLNISSEVLIQDAKLDIIIAQLMHNVLQTGTPAVT